MVCQSWDEYLWENLGVASCSPLDDIEVGDVLIKRELKRSDGGPAGTFSVHGGSAGTVVARIGTILSIATVESGPKVAKEMSEKVRDLQKPDIHAETIQSTSEFLTRMVVGRVADVRDKLKAAVDVTCVGCTLKSTSLVSTSIWKPDTTKEELQWPEEGNMTIWIVSGVLCATKISIRTTIGTHDKVEESEAPSAKKGPIIVGGASSNKGNLLLSKDPKGWTLTSDKGFGGLPIGYIVTRFTFKNDGQLCESTIEALGCLEGKRSLPFVDDSEVIEPVGEGSLELGSSNDLSTFDKFFSAYNNHQDSHGYPTLAFFIELEVMPCNDLAIVVENAEYHCTTIKMDGDHCLNMVIDDKVNNFESLVDAVRHVLPLCKCTLDTDPLYYIRVKKADLRYWFIKTYDHYMSKLQKHFMNIESVWSTWTSQDFQDHLIVHVDTTYESNIFEKKYIQGCKPSWLKLELHMVHEADHLLQVETDIGCSIRSKNKEKEVMSPHAIAMDTRGSVALIFTGYPLHPEDHFILSAGHGFKDQAKDTAFHVWCTQTERPVGTVTLHHNQGNVVEMDKGIIDGNFLRVIEGHLLCHMENVDCSALSPLVEHRGVGAYDLGSLTSKDIRKYVLAEQLAGRKVIVYKVGSKTGHTFGWLRDGILYRKTDRSTQVTYAGLLAVDWIPGTKQFTDRGDSGSLYFLKKEGKKVPIAVHVLGDTKSESYGVSIPAIIEELHKNYPTKKLALRLCNHSMSKLK